MWAHEDFLKRLLHSHPKPNRLREDGYLHVSDLLHKCPRMLALMAQSKAPPMLPPLTESMALTFAVGESIHDYVKNKLLIGEPDAVYGRWGCHCGKASFLGTYRQATTQEPCTHCSQPLKNYKEMSLRDEEINLLGNVDLTLQIDGRFLLAEIKSINKKQWDELTKPLPEHTLQILFYWWLAQRNSLPLYDAVVVLYVNKDFTFAGSPYKEFVFQPSSMLKRLDNYIEDAKMLKAAKAGGDLPYRICPKPDAPQAKKCPTVIACFHR